MPAKLTQIETDAYLKAMLEDGLEVKLHGADPGQNPSTARIPFMSFIVESHDAVCVNSEIRLKTNTLMRSGVGDFVGTGIESRSTIQAATHYSIVRRSNQRMVATGKLPKPLHIAYGVPVWLKAGTVILSFREKR